MGMELLRSLHSVSFEDWLPYDVNAGPAQSPVSVQPNGPRGRRRNNTAQANRMAITSRMPDLEETDVNKLEADQQATAARRGNIGHIEPAFLNDEDYPPGWLVFDPVLGVVSKSEADSFKREHEQKRNTDLKQSQSSQPQKPAITPRRKGPHGTTQNKASPSHFQTNQNNKPTPSRAMRPANVMSNTTMHAPIAANG